MHMLTFTIPWFKKFLRVMVVYIYAIRVTYDKKEIVFFIAVNTITRDLGQQSKEFERLIISVKFD